MSRKAKPKGKSLAVKCPWCGRTVGFSRSDRLAPHVGPGGVACAASGQTGYQVRDLSESHRKYTPRAKEPKR